MTPNQTIDRPSGGDEPRPGINGARPVGDVLAPIAGVVGPPASHPGPTVDRPRGVGGFYLAALVATGVSVDTSWRFFGDVLGITRPWERALMFAVLEIVLVACGWAMRANVRRGDRPGTPRIVALGVCGFSAFMAIALSGPVAGLARVGLGPVLALVALHLALGIEIRVVRGGAGTWGKIRAELRERALSLLGLGDDTRNALTRTQDRAAHRAARLATASRVVRRDRRLARAVRASGATTDPIRRATLVEQVAALRHVMDLRTVNWPSPWRAELDMMSDIAVDMSSDAGGDTGADTSRSSRRTQKRTPTATLVARLVARAPDVDAATVAAKLSISERQARRYLTTIRGQDPTQGAIPGVTP